MSKNGTSMRVMFLLAAAWLFVASAVAHAETPSTAIENVTVIDVVAGVAKPDMTVVVAGNKIASVGPASAATVPKGTRVVDGRGKFLIPGLWDMHVHLGNASEAALPVLIAYGITGVRDMGSPSFSTLRRWRIEALTGVRVGPRIVAPGPILTEGPPMSHEMVVHGAEGGRRAVDTLAGEGVDFIKVTQSLDRDTYFAVADEARKIGLPLAGHLPVNDSGDGFKVSGVEASNAGQKCLEHMHGIPLSFQKNDPELFPTLLRNGTWVDPTLTTYWARAHVHELALQSDPRLRHIAPSFKQWWDSQIPGFSSDDSMSIKNFGWRMSGVKTLYQAGVPLLAGTDLGFAYIYPGDLAKELELFVQAGLPALDALRTATINPARYLNMEKDLGSVETGKTADLVLLDGNPIEDIRSVRLVRAVVANGRFFDRAELDAGLPKFE
jgi:hypothetical protein